MFFLNFLNYSFLKVKSVRVDLIIAIFGRLRFARIMTEAVPTKIPLLTFQTREYVLNEFAEN